MKLRRSKGFKAVRTQDVTAFNPQLWANESLAILEENMVVGQLVHRDFSEVLANYGDTVNTRRPGTFTALRKDLTDSVTVQDATATNVQVVLNQHVHTSFLIRDGEETKAFKDLIQVYMQPAMLAQAQFVDRILLGQYPRFMNNCYGGLGQLTGSLGRQYMLGTRQIMNQNKAYEDGRNLVLTPAAEASLLNSDLFTAAYAVGDNGTALARAKLGTKLGFDTYMCQNMAQVLTGAQAPATLTGAINNAAGYGIGVTALTVDTFTGAVVVGDWITIAGDLTPYRISAHTETLSNTTAITLDNGLRAAVADNAVITTYKSGVTVGTSRSAGYDKAVDLSSQTITPQVGNMISFGSSVSAALYAIVAVNGTTDVTLDRPLDAGISSGDVVHFGPTGSFNMAFHRNALALVIRPLATPMPGTGALSAVVNHNGLSMRATITYDGNKQGHLVTLDFLCGIALLDAKLGAVMVG